MPVAKCPWRAIMSRQEQPCTLTRLHLAKDGQEQISVRWGDNGVDLPLVPAKEFTLISMKS